MKTNAGKKSEPRLRDFKENFPKLRGDNETQKEFAERIGVSLPTAGFYINGDRLPDALVLKNICQRCDVSADFLLGLQKEPRASIDEQGAHKLTGLSSRAIEVLEKLNKSGDNSSLLAAISLLIVQEERPSFTENTSDNEILQAIYDCSRRSAMSTINAFLLTQESNQHSVFTTNGDIVQNFASAPSAELTFGCNNSEIIESVLLNRLRDQLKFLKETFVQGGAEHGEH